MVYYAPTINSGLGQIPIGRRVVNPRPGFGQDTAALEARVRMIVTPPKGRENRVGEDVRSAIHWYRAQYRWIPPLQENAVTLILAKRIVDQYGYKLRYD